MTEQVICLCRALILTRLPSFLCDGSCWQRARVRTALQHRCGSSTLYTNAAERHGVTAHRIVWICSRASEVLSYLTCSTLIKALAILSWLPLITNTARVLPGLLCFPQSHWRITGECLLPRLCSYQAEAILAEQTSNISFLGLFTHWQNVWRWVLGDDKTFYPCVKSICLPKCCCRHTVNASRPSSLFYCSECCECYWCAGRLVIDGLTGMHNVTWGKAHSPFLPFSRHHPEWLWIHLKSIINITSLKSRGVQTAALKQAAWFDKRYLYMHFKIQANDRLLLFLFST